MYLDWKTLTQDTYVIDIEADSLTPTVIWVMCWENAKTGGKGECIGHDAIRNFFTETKGSNYVGHNLLRYDAPALCRLVGAPLSVGNCIDTLVLSQLYSPSIDGGHSLDAWGERLGKRKIEFSDFSRLTPEMVEYCHKDVSITTELFRRLVRTLQRINFSEESIWIQHRLMTILEKQRKNGFYFDGPRAISFYQELRHKQEELTDSIHAVFPPERKYVATRQKYKKDGTPTKIYEQDKERYIIIDGNMPGSYLAYEDVPFNIGSPQQRTQRLLDLGWVNLPDEVTKTGNPKPFDKGDLVPSLKQFLEDNPTPEVEFIAKCMSVTGRINMVNNWLENWDEDTHCIHGKLFVADTLRLRHQSPNTANIPAVRFSKGGGALPLVPLRGEDGFWTYEARDLWCARPGRVLVGTDAAGLELRMLAHFLQRPDFTDQVVNGDPHQYNADLVGITRPQAKTLIYATLYGASAGKIAKTLGVSLKEGGHVRTMFLEKLGLKSLIDLCKGEQAAGRVSLCDGSQVICPSPHAALNYKLQGSGARVMARGAIQLDTHVRRNKIDGLKVGDIHDEWQWDVLPDHAELHGELAVRSIREAGEILKLNVPLDGESKIGLTWAETH